MPQVGRVEVSIMEEDQSRLLAFQNGELDIMNMEGPLAPNVLDGGKLKPELASKGVKLSRFVDPEISYIYWNMQDPIVGGFEKEKVALRRAMAMAYNIADEIKVVRNGQAVEVELPDSAGGQRPRPRLEELASSTTRRAPTRCSTGSGTRRAPTAGATCPTASRSRSAMRSRPDTLGRQQDEAWKKSFDSIGIRMEVQKDKFPELLKLEKQCKLMMRSASWIADYPDGDNFMQLLYGPNIGQSNNACAKIPEYDRLYEQIAADARLAGAQQALSRDGEDHRGVRAVAAEHQPATATCWCSRRCRASRSIRSCTTNGQYIDVAPKPSSVDHVRAATMQEEVEEGRAGGRAGVPRRSKKAGRPRRRGRFAGAARRAARFMRAGDGARRRRYCEGVRAARRGPDARASNPFRMRSVRRRAQRR